MITKIVEAKNVNVGNIHNNLVFNNQKLLYISMGKEIRIIDLLANKDITDIDYLKIITTSKTKYKKIFVDELEEKM